MKDHDWIGADHKCLGCKNALKRIKVLERLLAEAREEKARLLVNNYLAKRNGVRLDDERRS